LTPDKTYFDGMYVRKYEPDFVKRAKALPSDHLQGHLKLEPFNGNPEQIFKNLLRPRN